MSSALLVIIMVASYFLARSVTEAYLRGKNNAVTTPQRPAELDAKPAWYDCPVSTERILEQRLVDGGVMDVLDMTVCENEKCPNCAPTREAKRAKELAERAQRQAEIRRRVNEHQKMLALNEKREAELERESRYVMIDGYRVERPQSVPNYAHGEFIENMPSYVLPEKILVGWKWIDRNGMTQYLKQIVLVEDCRSREAVNYHEDQMVKVWQAGEAVAVNSRIDNYKNGKTGQRTRHYLNDYDSCACDKCGTTDYYDPDRMSVYRLHY